MWVIFEGLDKAGKGTLEKEFLKATNFKHMVIDRGPVGYLTFDEIFGRNTKRGDSNFIHHARKISKSSDYMIVYCTASKKEVDKRLAEHGETCPYDYCKAQKLYSKNIDRYYKKDKVLILDTTDRTVEECVGLIVGKLKDLQWEARKSEL